MVGEIRSRIAVGPLSWCIGAGMLGLASLNSCADLSAGEELGSVQAPLVPPRFRVSAAQRLSTTTAWSQRPAVASNGDGFMVVWTERGASPPSYGPLRMTVVDAMGVAANPEGVIVADRAVSSDFDVQVAWVKDRYVVGWFGWGSNQTFEDGIYIREFDANGAPLTASQQMIRSIGTNGFIEFPFVFATDDDELLLSVVDEDRVVIASRGTLSTAPEARISATLASARRCQDYVGLEGICPEEEVTTMGAVKLGTEYLIMWNTGIDYLTTGYAAELAFKKWGGASDEPVTYLGTRFGGEPTEYNDEFLANFRVAGNGRSALVIHSATCISPHEPCSTDGRGHSLLSISDVASPSRVFVPSNGPGPDPLPLGALAYESGHYVALYQECQPELADVGLAWSSEANPTELTFAPSSSACDPINIGDQTAMVGNGKGQLLAASTVASGSNVYVQTRILGWAEGEAPTPGDAGSGGQQGTAGGAGGREGEGEGEGEGTSAGAGAQAGDESGAGGTHSGAAGDRSGGSAGESDTEPSGGVGNVAGSGAGGREGEAGEPTSPEQGGKAGEANASGQSGEAGSSGPGSPPRDDGGCSISQSDSSNGWAAWLGALLGLAAARRRKTHHRA